MLGSPIAHSLSPTLHRAAYAALGLDWVYDAHDVNEAGLAAFIAGLGSEWRGLSLTMPLKSAAIGLCSRVNDLAHVVGAVNTVLVEQSGDLVGTNTDVPGFVAAWREAGVVGVPRRRVRTATVLGAGATARSAVAALAEVGVRNVTVVLRSLERASAVVGLAELLGMDVSVAGMSETWAFPEVDLLVSALPEGALADRPDVADALVARARAVCDVVYLPRLTPLLAAARRSGLPCVEGFDLLLHQAALQVEAMAGADTAPIARMRSAGLAELGRRERIA